MIYHSIIKGALYLWNIDVFDIPVFAYCVLEVMIIQVQ